ncbi:Rep family protein [Streptococcus orisratti]|uniref:Rep family protein n=1 Tax=Streptococcus orisratti TaxID=114652 RepID=UPI0023F9EFD0|nr:Rep family protein [Streptococcus orisratti]
MSNRARQVMYVQDDDHLKVNPEKLPEILKQSNATEWAFIHHDKDDTRDHYHIFMKFKNPTYLSSIAEIFKDHEQFVQKWDGRSGNGYSYLIHHTDGSRDEYQYDPSEVIASFDFTRKIKEIEDKIKKTKNLTSKDIKKYVKKYADDDISLHELRDKIGDYNFTQPKIQRHVKEIKYLHDADEHEKWLKNFEGQKMEVWWIWGEGGVGKTRYARYLTRNDDAVILGTSNDYFQNYNGERVVIINDLRPNDFKFGDLLKLLDPYEHHKEAPRRYRNVSLNLEKVYITTPYSPYAFYKQCKIADRKHDSLKQLTRRIKSIHLTGKKGKKNENN